MNPLVKMPNFPKKPTCGQLDDGLTNLLAEDRRPDDRVFHVGHEEYSALSEMGQGELMDLSAVLGFPLSSSQLANHISRRY